MIVLHLSRRLPDGGQHHKYINPPPGHFAKKHITINGVKWQNLGPERRDYQTK